MSKTSEQVMKDALDFFVYLNRFKGWKFGRPRVLGKTCTLDGVKEHPLVRIGIELIVVNNVVYLSNMEIKGPGGLSKEDILSPEAVLTYYGKVFHVRNNGGSCWKITAPKDLDAFVEAYDRLAVRLGKRALFQ